MEDHLCQKQSQTPIESLGLPANISNELASNGLTTLEDVLNQLARFASKDRSSPNSLNLSESDLAELQQIFVAYQLTNDADVGSRDPLLQANIGVPNLPFTIQKADERHGVRTVMDVSPILDQQRIPIDVLRLSKRTYNAMQRHFMTTLQDVEYVLREHDKTGLSVVPNMGEKSIAELNAKYKTYLLSDSTEPSFSDTATLENREDGNKSDFDEQLRQTPIDVLKLSVRPHNALKHQGFNTLDDVAHVLMIYQSTRKVPVRNMGGKGINEVRAKFEQYLAEPVQQTQSVAEAIPTGITPVGTPCPNPFDRLSERDKLTIELRYGLQDGVEHTLDEVGTHIGGITRERIRQIISRSLKLFKRIAKWNQIAQAWFNHLEVVLDEFGEIASDEEITNALQALATELGFHPLGFARFLADFSEPNVIRMRLGTQRIWLLNRPMREKWFLYLATAIRDELEACRDFRTPSELLQVLQARPDCPQDLEQTFTSGFVRINPEFIVNENGCIGLEKWGRNRTSICAAALKRIGEPAHFTHIAKVVNEMVAPENTMTTHSVHAAVQRKPDTFARVGQGTYGLVEWGLQNAEFYPDIIEKIFHESGHPLTIQEVFSKVCEVRDCKEATITMYLSLGAYGRFKSFSSGLYGLTEWNEDQFTDLSHRGKRLLDAIIDDQATYKQKPKPEVVQALDDVDDLINNARARASVVRQENLFTMESQ